MSQEKSSISPVLDNLTCELIGMCLDALAAGEEVYPVLSYCTASEESFCFTFSDEDPEACLDAARAQVRELPVEVVAYAIAYTGFVQLDDSGATVDALLVEFGERGSACAYSAYIPYHIGKTEDEFESGEPLAAGEEPLLFN